MARETLKSLRTALKAATADAVRNKVLLDQERMTNEQICSATRAECDRLREEVSKIHALSVNFAEQREMASKHLEASRIECRTLQSQVAEQMDKLANAYDEIDFLRAALARLTYAGSHVRSVSRART